MQVDPDSVVVFLNELLATDADAVRALFAHRVRCNAALADHPTVQVAAGPRETSDDSGYPALPDGAYDVGFLGLLNGLFGVDERQWGFIAAKFEDGHLVGFERTPPPIVAEHPGYLVETKV